MVQALHNLQALQDLQDLLDPDAERAWDDAALVRSVTRVIR